MPRIPVSQLRINSELRNQSFLLREKRISTTRTGGTMLRVTLADRTGSIPGIMFDVPAGMFDQLQEGRGVEASGRVSEYRDQTQLTLERIVPTELSNPADFLPVAQRPLDEMEEELDAIIAGIEQPALSALLSAVFDDEETRKAFTTSPAAKYNHHACVGGLLEHTLSVARLVLTALTLHPQIDRDLAMTAALLHDLGKIDSYDPITFELTDQGTLWGHLYCGAARIERAITALPSFPDDLKLRLLHASLAHHGRMEYGSPVLPMTLEAIVVFQADQMDSSAQGAVDHYERSADVGGAYTDRSFMHDTKLFRGAREAPPSQKRLW